MSTTSDGTVTTVTTATVPPRRPLRRRVTTPAVSRQRWDEPKPRLARPSGRVSDRIWLIAVCAFAAVLVGSFLTLAISVFVRVQDATSAQVMLTVFTAVLGFLAGLFAPSPVGGKPE